MRSEKEFLETEYVTIFAALYYGRPKLHMYVMWNWYTMVFKRLDFKSLLKNEFSPKLIELFIFTLRQQLKKKLSTIKDFKTFD